MRKKNQYHAVFQSGELIKFVNTSNRYRVSLFSKKDTTKVRFDVIIACCEDIYGSYSIKKTIYIYIYIKQLFHEGALDISNHVISNKREWNNCFIKNAHKISLNLPD